jgi:hypothetical protein
MNNRIDFDFFEFCLMVENCIPPTTDKRTDVWKRVIDVYYHRLTKTERKSLYNFINANEIFQYELNNGNELCHLFKGRFNEKPMEVVTMINGVQEVCEAISCNGEWYYSSNRKINTGQIIEIRCIV